MCCEQVEAFSLSQSSFRLVISPQCVLTTWRALLHRWAEGGWRRICSDLLSLTGPILDFPMLTPVIRCHYSQICLKRTVFTNKKTANAVIQYGHHTSIFCVLIFYSPTWAFRPAAWYWLSTAVWWSQCQGQNQGLTTAPFLIFNNLNQNRQEQNQNYKTEYHLRCLSDTDNKSRKMLTIFHILPV